MLLNVVELCVCACVCHCRADVSMELCNRRRAILKAVGGRGRREGERGREREKGERGRERESEDQDRLSVSCNVRNVTLAVESLHQL